MQREISLETLFEGRKPAEVGPLLGISVHTYYNHLQAAFRSLGYPLTQDADVFTEDDRSVQYDRIEQLRQRYQAARLRRASSKTGERSTFQGERSNFEGDRANFEGDARSKRVHRGKVEHVRRNTGGHSD